MFIPSNENHLGDGIHRTCIDGLLFINHEQHKDNRGFYTELTRVSELNKHLNDPFGIVQVNQSRSEMHVTRGIHAEKWRKLVSITQGVCFSALVDLRPDSPTFKQIETFLLGYNDEAFDASLFIPQGLGNSMQTVEGPLDYIYCVDKLYSQRDPKFDRAIYLFDEKLNIPWPVKQNEAVISDRDRNGISLDEFLSQ